MHEAIPKYAVGQTVYTIQPGTYFKDVTCWVCGGDKRIRSRLDDSLQKCPFCGGLGHRKDFGQDLYSVNEPDTVAEIHIRYTDRDNPPCITYHIRCDSSGSFMCHDEAKTFATLEEAQAECNRLNEQK